MAFVLRSSDGILKDGQKFIGKGPRPVNQNVGEETSVNSPLPEPSSSAQAIDEDSSCSEEILNGIKSEHEHVQILNAYSLDPEAGNDELEIDEEVVNSDEDAVDVLAEIPPSPEVQPLPDESLVLDDQPRLEPPSLRLYEEACPEETSRSTVLQSDRITFEKIGTLPDIKPVVEFKIQKKSDPKIGTYYGCPKCFQKYVTEDCVKEHLEYCEGLRTSQAAVQRTLEPQAESGESADDSDEDPDFIPEETYQRNVKFPCNFCSRRFDSLPGLRAHKRIVHRHKLTEARDTPTPAIHPTPPPPPKPPSASVWIFCGICNQKFSMKRSLRRHLYNVHLLKSDAIRLWLEKDNLISSSEQEKQTPPAKRRKSSSTRPTENLRHPCDRCSSDFPTKELLSEHELQHRLEIEKPYSCNFCEKSFFLRSYLDDHEKTHVNEHPYACSVCGDCYSRKKDLDKHCSDNAQCSGGGGKSGKVDVIICD